MKNAFAPVDDEEPTWGSHPPFDRKFLRAIELALRAAWLALHKDYTTASALSTEREERVSLILRDALNELRERETGGIEGYHYDYFDRPQTGAEVLTPKGGIKKPDLVFALSGRRRPGVEKGMRDAIYVECKVIQAKSGKNVAAYCDKGVQRFVEGSYSAWMREGMMVAYVRSTQSLPDDLAKRLGTLATKENLACDGKLSKCALTRVEPRVYISVHQRNWGYREDRSYPGPIEIRHLWLHV